MDYKERNGNGFNKNYAKGQNAQNQDGRVKPKDFFIDYPFDPSWIKDGANRDFVTFADEAGKYMAPNGKNDKQMLSKSQIRNVFGEIKRIQLKGIDKPDGYTSFMLLKPKVAYAEGRNKTMGLTLFKEIFDKAWNEVGKDNKHYNNFCALIEAVLAYHKAYGGKD